MDSLRVQKEQRRELWQQVRGATHDATAVQKVIARRVQPTVAEEKLLGLLLASDELRNIILPRMELTDYEGLATETIFRALQSLAKEGQEISFDSLSQAASDSLAAAEVLPRLMLNETAESFDESLAHANSCLDALRLMKVDRRIDELGAELVDAERTGDAERANEVTREREELYKQRGNY
jgi:replicative DNA helicase